MPDVKYHKDYRHNYLIIKDNGNLSGNVYQRKMVTENRIQGLLVSYERYINGDILLYYEITSRQSLSSIYDGKSIGMKELSRFFVQLKVVNDMLQKYLLDGSSLFLLPEYIFQNIETGEYSFLYYPGLEDNCLSQLMDFFISRVDNEDMEALETIYKAADLVKREQFMLDEVLKWFQDDWEDESKKSTVETKYQNEECENNLWQENIPCESDKSAESFEKIVDKDKGKRVMFQMAPVWGLCLLGAGILGYIGYSCQLSYQEQIYFLAGWIITAVLFSGSVLWCLYSLFIQNKCRDEQGGAEEIHSYVSTCENIPPKPVSDMGNTVYIPWAENCENKLYSLDRKIKCHIDLGSLPITVGKLAGAVDKVIDEQSISRMHAKFYRNGNRVYVTDLNSTNGTFRNGMRLAPNASELIEPGDEIRLGKLKFIYR